MPTLEGLPDEIKLMIWNHIRPDDIESYSLVCPQTRAMGTNILKEHRSLKPYLTSVINYQPALEGAHEEACYIKTFRLLEIVTVNPAHGLYVKDLIIGGWCTNFETEAQFWHSYWRMPRRHWALIKGPLFKRYPIGTLPVLKQAVKESEYLDPEVALSWNGPVKNVNQGPLLAILLTLLPSLASLEINGIGADDNFLGFIEDTTRSPNPTIFSNLTSINLSGMHRWGEKACWKYFRVFFNIPSLKRLKARTLKDGNKFARCVIVEFPYERSSNVTDLDLQDCCLDEGSLGKILGRFRSLESFAYSWQRITRDVDQCIPIALRCAALDRNQFHLTRLDLRSDEGDSPCIGMLTHLIVLKYLKIEYPLVRRGLPLADALPSSLQEFHLHNESHWQVLKRRGMVDDGSHRLSSNARLELEEITTEMFFFGMLLLQQDNEGHPKLQTMTMIGNLSTESLILAVMASNQRPDVSLYVC